MKSWKLLQTKYYLEKLSKKYVQYLDWKKQVFSYIWIGANKSHD